MPEDSTTSCRVSLETELAIENYCMRRLWGRGYYFLSLKVVVYSIGK